jgi:hypothetical protein
MTTDPAPKVIRPVSRQDTFVWQILELMVIWAPYGGPPAEETMPRFGLSRRDFHARFRQIVVEFSAAGSTGFTLAQLRLLAKARSVLAHQESRAATPRRYRTLN